MARTTIDAKGQPCPQPVILAKKAHGEAGIGNEIEIVVDNATSSKNVERFLADAGASPRVKVDSDGAHHVIATKAGEREDAPEPAAYCGTAQSKPHVVCVKSDRMGTGDDELGEVLIHAFLNVLGEIEPLPSTLIFYNKGIMLALKDSPVIDSLAELESKGVKILVCGTCAKHFGKTDGIGVGVISNMYDIAEALSRAGHVVYP